MLILNSLMVFSEDIRDGSDMKRFCYYAILQGRVCYIIMSIHAVNPKPLTSLLQYDPHNFLFTNMLYGIAINVFCRPTFYELGPFRRYAYSIGVSMMFNYSTMKVYEWLRKFFSHKKVLLTVLGFIFGRLMMANFLAFLYHVDTKGNTDPDIDRDSVFEFIYHSNINTRVDRDQ